MKAYSVDLRIKIVESVRRGVSKSETACRFRVNRSTDGRYLKRLDENDSLAPEKAPGSHPKLDQSAMLVLEQDIKSRPWATHRQRSELLFGVCGVKVSEATICRSIKRLGHSRKKDRRSKRTRRVAEVGVALHGRQARVQAFSVCGRDGYTYVACSFVRLFAPR
jgi:transposase